MSLYPWQNSLNKLLRSNLAGSDGSLRLAIVGIGNEMLSDDAAGSVVARTLRARNGAGGIYQPLVIDAGVAPENITRDLRDFKPCLIVFIDAADMGEAPGTVRWIAMDEIDGMSASTHRMPISMLTQYLTLELNCDIVLLGIQPASVEMGEGLSDPVCRSVGSMVEDLSDLLMLHTEYKGIFVKEPAPKATVTSAA